MIGLHAVMSQGQILYLVRTLQDVDVPDTQIKLILQNLAKETMNAIVATGKTVVDDFNPDAFI